MMKFAPTFLADWLARPAWTTRTAAWLLAGADPVFSEGPHPEQIGGLWLLPGIDYPEHGGAWWGFERDVESNASFIEAQLAARVRGGFAAALPPAEMLKIAGKLKIVPPWSKPTLGAEGAVQAKRPRTSKQRRLILHYGPQAFANLEAEGLLGRYKKGPEKTNWNRDSLAAALLDGIRFLASEDERHKAENLAALEESHRTVVKYLHLLLPKS